MEQYTEEIETLVGLQDREEAYYQLVTLYLNSPEQVRRYIRKNWNFNVEWIFPRPGELLFAKNQSRSIKERIMASLVHSSIHNPFKHYYRESLVLLAMEYNSCTLAGLDPDQMFEFAASVSDPEMAGHFRDFSARKPENKSMKAFGLETKTNSDGETEILTPWNDKNTCGKPGRQDMRTYHCPFCNRASDIDQETAEKPAVFCPHCKNDMTDGRESTAKMIGVLLAYMLALIYLLVLTTASYCAAVFGSRAPSISDWITCSGAGLIVLLLGVFCWRKYKPIRIPLLIVSGAAFFMALVVISVFLTC